ncbi:MAG TPA: Wadjet anti-phage system protein JetD domain-containing protein [Desulfitobacteriaceae bacterium]|nr:Wadjet anti-phage system protein JetD domain-containing protein [Desulfitobacteriaceae bacterium]
MNEAKLILNRLLDKYEQSAHFSERGRSNRRVLIKTAGNGLPEYDYQNIHIRDAFNTAIHDLTGKKVVFAEWLPGRKQLVVKEIWLNLEQLEDAYILAERQPLQNQIDEYCSLLKTTAERVNTPWIKSFLTTQTEKLGSTNRLSGLYKKGYAHFTDVLSALEHIDLLDDSGMSMRAFSIACYRDSKYFEKDIRDDFLAIAREYCPPLAELLTDHDLSVREQLAYLGIYARPEIYEFAGPLSMETEDGICDCSPLARFGCAVTSAAVFGIRKLHMDNVHRIMFIENKTNYDEYIEKARRNDELVVFHGGFLSPQKKKFILQIVSLSPPHAEYLFWADIDMGGFKMFAQLKNLAPELIPWKMGPEEVEQYSSLGLKRNSRYLKELDSFLTLPDGTLFAETIKALLLYDITIEQEVMLNDL